MTDQRNILTAIQQNIKDTSSRRCIWFHCFCHINLQLLTVKNRWKKWEQSAFSYLLLVKVNCSNWWCIDIDDKIRWKKEWIIIHSKNSSIKSLMTNHFRKRCALCISIETKRLIWFATDQISVSQHVIILLFCYHFQYSNKISSFPFQFFFFFFV